jgi:5-methylcytosine-specific restriction endonuclease McrA
MLYNFFLGHTASVLSELLGHSVAELEANAYTLEEVLGTRDAGSYTTTDKEGNLFRLGFFLTHYNDVLWGKSPSLHIDFCDNVATLKHKMKATNSPYVTYYSNDSQTVYKNKKLKLCKKCLSIIRNNTAVAMTNRSFEEFILSIEEDDELKCKIPNKDGYAINWQQISKSFREYKEYTCEICKFKLNDVSHADFIHSHHINSYEKLNNKRSNLKCLCVKCHSEIDDYHKQKFSTIENQLLLMRFEQYKAKLK